MGHVFENVVGKQSGIFREAEDILRIVLKYSRNIDKC
jgi:hypothetical protein